MSPLKKKKKTVIQTALLLGEIFHRIRAGRRQGPIFRGRRGQNLPLPTLWQEGYPLGQEFDPTNFDCWEGVAKIQGRSEKSLKEEVGSSIVSVQ